MKKDLQKQNLYVNILAVGYPGVAQLVARLTGGQEAVSSSLATRTSREPRHAIRVRGFFLFKNLDAREKNIFFKPNRHASSHAICVWTRFFYILRYKNIALEVDIL